MDIPPVGPSAARRRWPYAAAIAAGLAVIAVAYLIVRPDASPGGVGSSVAYGRCDSAPIALPVAASIDKRDVMTKLAAAYNTSSRLFDGRCAKVDVFAEASGDLTAGLAVAWNPDEHGGHPAPVVVSPASSQWLRLLTQRNPPVQVINADNQGRAPSLAKTPLVLALPAPMATALDERISWAELLRMADDPQWWAGKGHPEWGSVKLGKTNPHYSTSGLHATIATYAAAAAAHRLPFNESTVDSNDLRDDVARVEKATVHYGETALTFLANLAEADAEGRGLSYISAVAVEEKLVYDYNQGRPDGDLTRPPQFHPKVPLVSLYPTDGTIVSDNPYAILSNATDAQRAAARDFLKYLLEPAQQDAFRTNGFRGADGRLGGHLAAGNGLRPDAQINEIPLPAPAVLAHIVDSWHEVRKPARVLFAFDVSGSMGEDPFDKSTAPRRGQTKLDLAKTAAIHALELFSPQDRVGLWSFSGDRSTGRDAHTERVPLGPFSRDALRTQIDALQPELSTALYTTIRDAYDALTAGAGPDTITALVVLTDGRNEWDTDTDVQQLRRHIDAAGKDNPVRVFTIAYGHDADYETLTGIARTAGGWSYDATDPRSLDKIMRQVVSNF